MSMTRLVSAAVIAAAGFGIAGAAGAAPALNLSGGDEQAARRDDGSAVTPVWHRYHYGYYSYSPYYYSPYYYYPRYYGYYSYPYYYGPSVGFGFTIR